MHTTVHDILDEPTGSLYHNLLDIALDDCNLVQFVVRHSIALSQSGSQVLTRLEPYRIKTQELAEWPGTVLIGETATVLTYKYEPPCADALHEAADHLYAWMQPSLPEDLCLLRSDGTPWLVTIAHERDGYLQVTDDEKDRLLSRLPDFRIG